MGGWKEVYFSVALQGSGADVGGFGVQPDSKN